MRISRSVGASAAVAAVFTHGMVFSGVNFDESLAIGTYQGFFQQMLLAAERLWSLAHGWPPMSHFHDFGHFYAPVVRLIGPLTGFALFRILSGQRVGSHLWKPLAIALVLAVTPGFSGLTPGYLIPWVEMARTVLIVWLMVWSVGAIGPSGIRLPGFPSGPTLRRGPA